MRQFALLALAFLGLATIASAAEQEKKASWSPQPGDWPTIFGNFQNTSSVEDPTFKPPFRLKWATRIEGQMKASAVLGDGRIFAQTVDGLISALDQETGKILWRNYYPGVLPEHAQQNRTSPLYAAGRLYYAYYPGGLYCVEAATGKELWKDPDGLRLAGRFSPLWHDGMIFYPYWVRSQDNKTRYVIFKALDAATGKEVWRKEYPEFSNPNSVLSPAPAVSSGCIGDGLLFVSLGASTSSFGETHGILLALDPRTGREVWKNKDLCAGGSLAYLSYSNGKIYVGGRSSPYRCLDAKTCETFWEIQVGSRGTLGSTVSPQGIAIRTYGSPAFVYDLATGKPTLGKNGKQVAFGRGGSTGCSPLIIVNGEWGIQHSGGESRRISVGRIDRTETVWEFQVAGRACAGSAVSKGCIYTPSNGDGLLYCFEHDDGRKSATPIYEQSSVSPSLPKIGVDDWPQLQFDGARSGSVPAQGLKTPLTLGCQVKLDAPCFASPAVMNGKVFVVDADGTAYGIDPAAQKILWKRPTGGVNNRSSPVAVGGRVYFGSADRNFYVLNADDGQVVKKVPTPHGIISSPALTDEARLYIQSFDGTLLALDLDANVLWTLKLQPTTWWLASQSIAPAPHDVAARGRDILAVAGNTLFKVRDEGKAGKVVWTHHGAWASGASFVGDSLLIGNAPAEMEHQVLQCLLDDKITKRVSGPNGDTRNGYVKAVWPIGRVNAPPSASATRACFGSTRGGFWSVDISEGAKGGKPIWSTARVDRPSFALVGAVGFSGGAALTRDHCIFGGLDGKLYVIRLDAKGEGLDKLKPAATVFESPDKSMIFSSPAISKGVIYYTTAGGNLYGWALTCTRAGSQLRPNGSQ